MRNKLKKGYKYVSMVMFPNFFNHITLEASMDFFLAGSNKGTENVTVVVR